MIGIPDNSCCKSKSAIIHYIISWMVSGTISFCPYSPMPIQQVLINAIIDRFNIHVLPHSNRFRLKTLFVLCPQLGQDLLVAGLAAGDAVKVAAGGFADRHPLGGKGSTDVAEIAFVLRGSIFLGSRSSHINISSYNLNTDLACQVASFPQITRKLVLSSFQNSTKLVLSDVPSSRSSWTGSTMP